MFLQCGIQTGSRLPQLCRCVDQTSSDSAITPAAGKLSAVIENEVTTKNIPDVLRPSYPLPSSHTMSGETSSVEVVVIATPWGDNFAAVILGLLWRLRRKAFKFCFVPADVNECLEEGEGHSCSDICINTPGSFHCACPAGKILEEDGRTCRGAVVSWRHLCAQIHSSGIFFRPRLNAKRESWAVCRLLIESTCKDRIS